MEKKYSIVVIAIITILVIMGLALYMGLFKEETIKVGETNFVLPSGFSAEGINEIGDLIISDHNNNQIFLAEYKNDTVGDYIKHYIHERNLENQTISSSNFTIGSTTVYKTTNKNTSSNHYWFVKDGKTYAIYNWNKIENMDNIVFDLIKSTY